MSSIAGDADQRDPDATPYPRSERANVRSSEGEDLIDYVVDRQYANTRMPPVDRRELSAADQAIFDRVAASGDGIGDYRRDQRSNYFQILLNNPRIASNILTLTSDLKGGDETAGLSAAMDNLVLIAVAAELPCRFLLIGHIPDAIATGVRPEAVRAILDRDDGRLTADERLLCEAARAIVRCALTDETYSKLEGLLGRSGSVAFIVRASNLSASRQIFSALGIPEPSWEQVEKVYQVAERLNRTGTPGLGIERWPGPPSHAADPQTSP